jgi:hypothetical protein
VQGRFAIKTDSDRMLAVSDLEAGDGASGSSVGVGGGRLEAVMRLERPGRARDAEYFFLAGGKEAMEEGRGVGGRARARHTQQQKPTHARKLKRSPKLQKDMSLSSPRPRSGQTTESGADVENFGACLHHITASGWTGGSTSS